MKPLYLVILALILGALACTLQTTPPTPPPATRPPATVSPGEILATVTRVQISPTLLPVGNKIPTFTPTTTPQPAICEISTGYPAGVVNVRACAGVDCAILTQANEGDRLTVLAPGAWVKVQSGDTTGWVNSKFCEVKP